MSAPAALGETFAALGDETRLAIVKVLRRGARRSSDIADALDLSRPNASRHLKVLKRAGIVEDVPAEDARERTYRLRPERFERMRTWLDEVEAFWENELMAFKAHVEKGARSRKKGLR